VFRGFTSIYLQKKNAFFAFSNFETFLRKVFIFMTTQLQPDSGEGGRQELFQNSNNYWDDRYTKDREPLDWLQTYNSLREIFHRYLRPSDRMLNVGVGNSPLSTDMRRDGFIDIFNIDISAVVIEQMLNG